MSQEIINIFIIAASLLLILIIISSVLIIRYEKNLKYNAVFNKIKKLDIKFEALYLVNKEDYDIYAETDFSRYFIKIISVNKNTYLKIDNNFNYFLVNKKKEKNINNLLNIKSYKFKVFDAEKRIHKIIVLYPGVDQKLFYNSNVEARFIYPTSEFQGVKIANADEIENVFYEQII